MKMVWLQSGIPGLGHIIVERLGKTNGAAASIDVSVPLSGVVVYNGWKKSSQNPQQKLLRNEGDLSYSHSIIGRCIDSWGQEHIVHIFDAK